MEELDKYWEVVISERSSPSCNYMMTMKLKVEGGYLYIVKVAGNPDFNIPTVWSNVVFVPDVK